MSKQPPADAHDSLAKGRAISAAQLLQSASTTGNTAYRVLPRQKEINDVIDNAIQLALLGKQDPDTALNQAQDAVNRILQEE
jgi:ABC-type glycerol-3-phosphate transport system substrate-binding protein